MIGDRSADSLIGLIRELCKQPHETEWLEFKKNYARPQGIGEYISAMANSAVLAGKSFAYMVWGVCDDDHTVVGTTFDHKAVRVGGEELETWLLRLLEPKIDFRFFRVDMDGHSVVLLEVARSDRQPVRFSGTEYVRVGSSNKKLKDLPEKERALWRSFEKILFEEGIAVERLSDEDVLGLLDYPAFFDLLQAPLPANRNGILAALADDDLIGECDAGGWNITHLGAILFAKRLDLARFGRLRRKTVRVVQYRSFSRTEALREYELSKGYACGFEELIRTISGLLPLQEVIISGLRKSLPMVPEISLRELVANALIHQDFSETGARPMVEIFDSRIEITNPGRSLVDVDRFINSPPKARNEALASLMRRLRICEERGSGIDKVVSELEKLRLPAPDFRCLETLLSEHQKVSSTRATLFAETPLSALEEDERVRACYWHACLKYENKQPMTEISLRERLGIEESDTMTASQIISEAIRARKIVRDPGSSESFPKYAPSWVYPHAQGEGDLRAHTETASAGGNLERLFFTMLTGSIGERSASPSERMLEQPSIYSLGWICGTPDEYDCDYCVDLLQLQTFLQATQPKTAGALSIYEDGKTRRGFLARLQGEITRRGTIDVLRHGLKHGAHDIDLFYSTPSPGNEKAKDCYDANRFSVTRRLRYSRDETERPLDIVLFVNGLPFATFEFTDSYTKHTIVDAVQHYMRNRNTRERLFEFGRPVVHFAVTEHEVCFCTHLKGKESWFLPFNQGWNDGAGNPPNPRGLRTEYLCRQILTRQSLTEIIESYAQVIERRAERTRKKTGVQIWPRYHQLDLVRRLLKDLASNGAGRRYLVQHSAGSGKSNSIAWLAHQLIGLRRDGHEVFDSILVVSDRRMLDRQILDSIRKFTQVGSTVGHAEYSRDLRRLIKSGKKIIISTVQKFPFILDEIGTEHCGRSFAIIIDEAHSSQEGRNSAAMRAALSRVGAEAEDETSEDRINRAMESRKPLSNATYFAFTATPKSKTREIFGERVQLPDGQVQYRSFHRYTMKQAIEERFILDVLKSFTPVSSYYRLIKTVEDDPEFDTRKARKKLRRYVESHDHAIRLKSEIVVDHFHQQVIGRNKIGGQARAMVVTSGIERAVQYYQAIGAYLLERKSPYRAIVAFSGEHDFGDGKVTEGTLNGFPSSHIADRIQEDPYRFLVCADKFQTGYDEPLLHTMYVDKVLSGIKAVQTLSRLNRAHPKKHDVFVLDFMNDADTIEKAFADYYRTTILSDETDPNKLHDLQADLDRYEVYEPAAVEALVELFLGGAERDRLDPILDACVATYNQDLDEDGQVDFKGKAKAFVRTYEFLATILPYTKAEWEKLSIFLSFLVPKLPAPKEADLSRGILETIDMDSYRVEKKAAMSIRLPDDDAEIGPVPGSGGGRKPEPELDRLSNIIRAFNDQFGNAPWSDRDRVERLISVDIPDRVAADTAYQNAKRHSDRQNARIEHDKALGRVMTAVLKDDTELFKLFSDNEGFRRWLTDTVFALTYEGKPSGA